MPEISLFLIAAALAVTGCASSSASSSTNAASSPASPTAKASGSHLSGARRHHHHRRRHHSAHRSAVCPSSAHVLDGVYHPERLQVLDPCRTAAGRVVVVRHEPDGDLHIDVALDAKYSSLTNAENASQQHGDLVVEFMARDGGHLPEPSVGDRIRLVGAWVDDTDHAWNEIHPVWSVRLNGGARSISGPQYGGSPSSDRSDSAAADCRTAGGGACSGYGGSTEEPSAPRHHHSAASTPSSTSGGGGAFCSSHRCIPSFSDGTGYIVQCNDGEWSHSGGRPGVCSGHGGASGRTYP